MPLVLVRRLAGVALMAATLVLPAAAPAAPMWNSGALVESTITDCGSIIFGNPSPANGLGTYASVYEDYNSPPPANQGYYVAIDVYGIGNACSGQAVDIAVSLPANTQPNISAATPVHCIPLLTQNNQVVNGTPDTSSGCPQSATAKPNNTYEFTMGANTGFFATMFFPFWGIPIGSGVEMQIPVVSSAALPSASVTGVIQVADGNNNPTLHPTVPVIVGAAQSQPPAGTNFAINNPATTNITDTNASLTATFVIDYSINPSNVEFDWGPTSSYVFGQNQSLDYGGTPPFEDQRTANISGLQPGCTYHWVAKLNGSFPTVYATTGDQTFTTTGASNGSCAIGMGTGGGQGPAHIQKVQPLNPASALPVKFTPPPAPPAAPPTPTPTTQTTPAPPPPTGDQIKKLTVAAKTVVSGKPVTVQITLATAAKVKVTIVRHVPAAGHGKHRRKAHDVTLGTKTLTGKVGVNALRLTTISGHKLVPGSYTAKVVSGGKSHSINFTVKAPSHRRH